MEAQAMNLTTIGLVSFLMSMVLFVSYNVPNLETPIFFIVWFTGGGHANEHDRWVKDRPLWFKRKGKKSNRYWEAIMKICKEKGL